MPRDPKYFLFLKGALQQLNEAATLSGDLDLTAIINKLDRYIRKTENETE